MRTKGIEDYGVVSRRSIQSELTQPKKLVKAEKVTRIAKLSDKCEYISHKYLFVGKAMRLVCESDSMVGCGWYEFVYNEDRLAANRALGYSDYKKNYLLYKPVLK